VKRFLDVLMAARLNFPPRCCRAGGGTGSIALAGRLPEGHCGSDPRPPSLPAGLGRGFRRGHHGRSRAELFSRQGTAIPGQVRVSPREARSVVFSSEPGFSPFSQRSRRSRLSEDQADRLSGVPGDGHPWKPTGGLCGCGVG